LKVPGDIAGERLKKRNSEELDDGDVESDGGKKRVKIGNEDKHDDTSEASPTTPVTISSAADDEQIPPLSRSRVMATLTPARC
jgi:hypothetical protein